MCGESFALQTDTVRQHAEVFSELAEQTGQKHLIQTLHALATAIEEPRAFSQSEGAIAVSDACIVLPLSGDSFDLGPTEERARAGVFSACVFHCLQAHY